MSEPLNLGGECEWAGLWWLPDEPDHQVPGTLRYTEDGGLRLALIGAFEDRIMSHPAEGVVAVHEGSRSWDVIWGAAEHKEITLLGCVPSASKRTLGARVSSPDKQTVVATSVLIGVYVHGEDDAAFSQCEVSVENLGHWAASSVFEGQWGAPGGALGGACPTLLEVPHPALQRIAARPVTVWPVSRPVPAGRCRAPDRSVTAATRPGLSPAPPTAWRASSAG